MPTNEFKPFSIAGGANVISQADYEALSALSTGFSSGVAKSNEINKVLRQSTFIAAAIAQFVSDKANVNVMDDGSLSGFITKLVNALNKVSQPLDGTLSALATLTTGDNKLPYFTGTDTASQTDLTSVGRDLIGKGSVSEILQYLGLNDTVDKAKGAVQKTGDEMSGKLTLPQTSSFGVNVNNNIGGSSIAIGDNDTGFKSGGDGIISLIANSVVAGYFSENELQHHGKVLTKIFRAISTGNATEGAGGFGSQLTSGAPFYSPAIVRQNNDNNYFPLWKQIVSLQSGYPVAASMGLLTTGETNFPQIVLHAKTDFEVNDKLWVFDVATGELRSPALIKAGEAVLNTNGDVSGSAWGG
ncbi:gp53-like domain-containing protein, partial [Enterobacter hormaechei]